MNLSPTEKARIKEVRGTYRSQTAGLRQSLKPAMLEARAARQKGDTAAARAIVARTKGDRDKLHAVMLREKNDVRSVLSPANQKQFDANAQMIAQRRGGHGKKQGRVAGGSRPGGAKIGAPNA